MGKIRIEVCMISAHGLSRSSFFWKPQWFAVGWVDPNNKYCTKVDNTGSQNPTWKTKFSVTIDDATSSNTQGPLLTIEVYRREPIFHREKLQGTATVSLKEFFKFAEDGAAPLSGSYQLRKQNSSKPQGFVDVSIRIMGGREGFSSYSGFNEGFHYSDHNNETNSATEARSVITYPTHPQPPRGSQFGGYTDTQARYPYPPALPSSSASGEGYHRATTPPPPPPPSNTGFMLTLFPVTRSHVPESYRNLLASGTAGGNSTPDFSMELGAGALVAGAVIFGDDFMSGSTFPSGF